MVVTLLTMAGIIMLGGAWRWHLGETTADQIRQVLTRSVYELFLPALIVHMLWHAPVNINTFRIPALAALCIMVALLVTWLMYRFLYTHQPTPSSFGALLLAAGFGNFTYFGLPILTQTFGEHAGIIVIQFDLLACTPLLFTVGVFIATHYGQGEHTTQPTPLLLVRQAVLQMFHIPALWAVMLGLVLSALHVPKPEGLLHLLQLLGSAVIPLMLLTVGMALQWQKHWLRRLPILAPVLLAQLLMMPAVAWLLCLWWHIPSALLAQIVIEAGMPSMVLGLVVCDRFKLDTSIYAEAITVSTLFSLLTLPFWWYWLE